MGSSSDNFIACRLFLKAFIHKFIAVDFMSRVPLTSPRQLNMLIETCWPALPTNGTE